MRKTLIIDFVLGVALQIFQGQEDDKAVGYIEKIVTAKRSGENVDAHLQTVADYLLGGERPDFDDLISRVNSEVDELLARESGEEEPTPDTPESAPSEDGTTGEGDAAASASQPETGPSGEGGDTPAGPPDPE